MPIPASKTACLITIAGAIAAACFFLRYAYTGGHTSLGLGLFFLTVAAFMAVNIIVEVVMEMVCKLSQQVHDSHVADRDLYVLLHKTAAADND